MTAARAITACRICKNDRLEQVLDLGAQVLTGVFPRTKDEVITRGPLALVKCHADASAKGSAYGGIAYDDLLFWQL